jgi:hypothetical protein
LDASPLFAREEFEQEIMALYQAEYMVGGTCWWPSKVIENQGASLGRLAGKHGFQIWVESQKERLRFDPRPMVEVVGAVSRVKMNAKVQRP